ncbi:MAG: class I SAM-dependent methyltransferase [Acidobacteria bacterium]|nr:class I SAM-dependent methyltransferase [Acidobacteriota bacterium]
MSIDYTDPNADVPPGVDFLNALEVDAWVAACEVDKPWRVPMRQRFADLLSALPNGATALEIGSGPGLLAECILEACPNIESYTLLDWSEHMLDLSKARLSRFHAAQFIQADFKQAYWRKQLSPPYSAVVAMQAVHEIRHKRHVPGFYRQVRDILEPGGVLAVCDGIPRDTSILWQTSLLMTVEEQLEALTFAGFANVQLESQLGATVFVTGRAPK